MPAKGQGGKDRRFARWQRETVGKVKHLIEALQEDRQNLSAEDSVVIDVAVIYSQEAISALEKEDVRAYRESLDCAKVLIHQVYDI